FKVTNCRNLPLDWLLRSKRLHPFCILHFAFSNSPINPRAPLITHRAASDEKFFRQSKQKAARIVDPIRRIFVTNDGKDSVDSLCEGFLEVPPNLKGRLPPPCFGLPFLLLLPYTEHPPQDRGEEGRGTQNNDLHEGTFLSIMYKRGRSQYMPSLNGGRKHSPERNNH
ncbi:MAG: hypothetical protein IKM33_06500, partial [Clostridia bacterium]|nr:hypothetical protein [Clostridia bacterium]